MTCREAGMITVTMFWGTAPPLPPLEFGKAKTVQNLVRFCATSHFDREYLRNGWRHRQAETAFSTTIPHGLFCADVPLRNSLTHWHTPERQVARLQGVSVVMAAGQLTSRHFRYPSHDERCRCVSCISDELRHFTLVDSQMFVSCVPSVINTVDITLL